MPIADLGKRGEECCQEGSLEMGAATCTNASEYSLLACRFRLLNLVQRIAHVDVMDMIEEIGLDALTSKEVLERFSHGTIWSNTAGHARDSSMHSVSSKMHVRDLEHKGYRNNFVRDHNRGSSLFCTPRGKPSFSVYVPRRTRDDDLAIAAAFNNQPSSAAVPGVVVNKNKKVLEKESALDTSPLCQKSVMGARGSHRLRSNDEKDAFFSRMAVSKHHCSEPPVENVHIYDQSKSSKKGEEETATPDSITPALQQLHPMSKPARGWREKAVRTRTPSVPFPMGSPHTISTDKAGEDSTIGRSLLKDDNRAHLGSVQGTEIRGSQDQDPVSQSSSSMTHVPGTSRSSQPQTDLTPLSHPTGGMAPHALGASHDMNTSVNENSRFQRKNSRKRVKPVLTLSLNNDARSTRHIACSSPIPKAKPLSPSGTRHLPIEDIRRAASILSEKLPSIAFLKGPETQQRQSATPSQPPFVVMESSDKLRHETVCPRPEVGIQVSLDNIDSLHQLSDTIDKMLQDHQQILQEVMHDSLEVPTLEANKTETQGTSGEVLFKGTAHGVIPTLEMDAKATDETECDSLYDDMLAYSELQQRVESMETELERVEASVHNDKREDAHYSMRISMQERGSKDFSKNGRLTNSLSFPNETTLMEQRDGKAMLTALPSLNSFSTHAESRTLQLKQQSGKMPDTVVRRLLAHQHTTHEYIAYNERQYNTSRVSQYVFAQRLTSALLEDCFSEVLEEVGHIMDDYVLGLVDHELR